MKRTGRFLTVPEWLVLCALAVFVGVCNAGHLFGWWFGVPHELFEAGNEQVYKAVLFAGCVGIGLFRSLAHPMLAARYAQWLATTPWSPRKPLPLGSAHLRLADLALPLIFGGVGWWVKGIDPSIPIAGLALGYVVMSAATIGPLVEVVLYPLAALVGLAIFLWPHTRLIAATGLAACALVQWGISKSLWRMSELREAKPVEIALGWPFESIGPGMPNVFFTTSRGLAISAVVAWVACALFRAAQFEVMNLPAIQGLALCLVAGRTVTYLGTGCPTTGLQGRLATGRLLIPGYDQIFVAPLCAAAAVMIVPRFLVSLHAPIAIATATMIFCSLAITLFVGPTLRVWKLTGEHRVPAIKPRVSSAAMSRVNGGD